MVMEKIKPKLKLDSQSLFEGRKRGARSRTHSVAGSSERQEHRGADHDFDEIERLSAASSPSQTTAVPLGKGELSLRHFRRDSASTGSLHLGSAADFHDAENSIPFDDGAQDTEILATPVVADENDSFGSDVLMSRKTSLGPSIGLMDLPPTDDVTDTKKSARESTGKLKRRLSDCKAKMFVNSPNRSRASTIAKESDIMSEQNVMIKPGKITGFAVASAKRDKDFHVLFKQVDDFDHLIDDYGCALSRDILLQGRMYVSEQKICFNSNIFGWITNFVIDFSEVVSIEKRSTALLFPNAIQITTLHSKNIFASFISRDTTYDLLVNIWRLSHPSTNIKADPNGADMRSQEEKLDDGSVYEGGDSSFGSSVSFGESGAEDVVDISSEAVIQHGITEGLGDERDISKGRELSKNLGPKIHKPTQCECSEHYDKVILEETITSPLGEVWDILFSGDAQFIRDFLSKNQKVTELDFKDGWKQHSDGTLTRDYSFIKPLNSAVGPKQTKCNCSDIALHKNFEDYCTVHVNTATPDVPSGNAFIVKTSYCLTWAEKNATKLSIYCTVQWNKTSWLKSPIEKGSVEGQRAYAKALVNAVRHALKRKFHAKPMARKKRRQKVLSEIYKPTPDTYEAQGLVESIGSKTASAITSSSEYFTLNFFIGLILLGIFIEIKRLNYRIAELIVVLSQRSNGRL